VGKTDESLAKRLRDHLEKLSARVGIVISNIGFCFLYLDKNWATMAHEASLIESHKLVGAVDWNSKGFGNHDPGRERDSTKLDDDHFDRRFPINPEVAIELPLGTCSIFHALSNVKQKLPYLLRFQFMKGYKPKGSHPDYESATVTLTEEDRTVRNVLAKIVDALGPEWQVTILYGYVILYKEVRDYSPGSALAFKRGRAPWIDLRSQ
jgi:hypothetical protein